VLTGEDFEDTTRVFGIRISKKNRPHNDQKKVNKRTDSNIEKIRIKIKIE